MARAMGMPLADNLAQYALLIGSIVEVPIMLLVLLRRSQYRLDQEHRLSGSTHTDQATGLAMEPVFIERGNRMVARCRRFGHQAMVVLVDIANAERIERDFEQHRPNELPARVASRLVAIAREVDVVARLSDCRFGLLVEGPISETEEATIGPRVVASCLMPFADKPEGWVARVRVAYALVPFDGTDMTVLIERLSALLEQVPADDNKAVFTLGTGSMRAT
jgi:two-component system, sensor histidine kinase LadS